MIFYLQIPIDILTIFKKITSIKIMSKKKIKKDKDFKKIFIEDDINDINDINDNNEQIYNIDNEYETNLKNNIILFYRFKLYLNINKLLTKNFHINYIIKENYNKIDKYIDLLICEINKNFENIDIDININYNNNNNLLINLNSFKELLNDYINNEKNYLIKYYQIKILKYVNIISNNISLL